VKLLKRLKRAKPVKRTTSIGRFIEPTSVPPLPDQADQPDGVCAVCWFAWRADEHRTRSIYCKHSGTVAGRTPDGRWRYLHEVDADDLTVLREAGAL